MKKNRFNEMVTALLPLAGVLLVLAFWAFLMNAAVRG